MKIPVLARTAGALAVWLFAPTGFAANPTSAPKPLAQTPAELTAGDFFRPPAVSVARLNPGGTHLAMMVAEENTDSTGLRVIDLATMRATGLRGTETHDTYSFHWAGDEKIVFNVIRDNLYATGLFVGHRDRLADAKTINLHDAVEVLGSPRARPDHLFVWIRSNARDEGRQGFLYELDLRREFRGAFGSEFSNSVGQIRPPPKTGVSTWLRDRTGEVRYAVALVNGVPQLFQLLPRNEWKRLPLDLEQFHPLAVDSDPATLLVARRTPHGLRELVRLNIADGTTGPVLHTDEKYDFRNAYVHVSGDDQEVIGLTYAQHTVVQLWWREKDVVLQQTIDQALPGRVNLITNRNRDGTRMVVLSLSDRHPGTFYLYEPEASRLGAIANLAPWLPENLLGEVRLMSFKARDGLALDGYVTLPSNHVPDQPAPMVVLPHGGPWVRDVWGYNPEAQFFASRGYVVFQPNYRGSAGYGADISVTPRAEFRRMHDDVTDGTRALIKSGIADPARIAIVGTSFGGYLAVCGAAFEPDLYRCAVTIAGIFDWERVMREARNLDPDPYRYEQLLRMLGDPRKLREKFEAMSPFHSVGQIKVPIFVAHGGDDRVADSSQSRRLIKAFAKARIPHETMLPAAEGHGFSALKNRVELYERVESFLKKHL